MVEGDQEHYAFQTPFLLIPDLSDSDITNPLTEENYRALMPISLGLTVGDTGDATVTSLLTTSDAAFSKLAGYDLDTYEKEEGDIDGPFALAVSVETAEGGGIVWFSSSVFLEDTYNAYSSGANLDLGMNALSSLIGEREALAIRTKSLSYNYLTISESAAGTLKVLLIGLMPLLYLGIGIYVVAERRRKQNETV